MVTAHYSAIQRFICGAGKTSLKKKKKIHRNDEFRDVAKPRLTGSSGLFTRRIISGLGGATDGVPDTPVRLTTIGSGQEPCQ
jgi:hypothetical protein